MSSSRTQCHPDDTQSSLEESRGKSASIRQRALFQTPTPGSLNDEVMVRSVLVASIKASGKSREQIADEMSEALGVPVTSRMITAFTAESKELHRWPGAWDRAFCYATGDDRLLVCRVQAAGLRVIDGTEQKLLDLGRHHLRRKHAEQAINSLELQFAGVDL